MHEREHEDEDLGDQEDPTLSRNAVRDVRERLAEDRRIEERLLDVVPAGRVDDCDAISPTTTSVLSVATATARLPPGDAEPRMREPLLPVSALPEVRSAGPREVRPLEPS